MEILNFDSYLSHGDISYHFVAGYSCIFCSKQSMKMLHHSREAATSFNPSTFGSYESILVVCPNCGWWVCTNQQSDYGDVIQTNRYQAILKSFTSNDKNIPIEILNKEITKNPELLYSVHYKKMEEITQFVFSSFYACEVIHCGRTGDGGIDLMIVNSDEPIAIQVKRRTKKNAKEGIDEIRNFIGALTIAKLKKGIFVTTAKDFTKGVYNTQGILNDKNIVSTIELFNFNDFISIFNLAMKDNCKYPWESVLLKLKNVEIDENLF